MLEEKAVTGAPEPRRRGGGIALGRGAQRRVVLGNGPPPLGETQRIRRHTHGVARAG